MQETIYIDVIFLENFLMNYLLLYGVKRYCSYKVKWWSLPLASVIGTLYVFAAIIIDTPSIISLFMKFLISIVMVSIAFNQRKFKKLVRSLILFYMVAFIISGSILAVFYLFKFDFQIVNGAYILRGVKSWHLITGSFIANLFIKLAFDTLEKYHEINNNVVMLKIILQDKSCELKALVDTGNSLCDPITHEGVLIVYIKSVLDILPIELRKSFSIFDKKAKHFDINDSFLSHVL